MAEPIQPYKGLAPYSEEDSKFFFGREKESLVSIANLRVSKLTLVYGNTGAGKSSVLSAGVAYQLREITKKNLDKEKKAGLLVIIFKSWREEPLRALKKRIIESTESQKSQISNLLSDLESLSLSQVLKYCSEMVGGHILIILDQFEQYFLWHPNEWANEKFDTEFSDAVNDTSLPVNFLISIREEWFAQLDRFKGKIPNLFENYLRIKYLDRNAARAAIEGPLEIYNNLQKNNAQPFTVEQSLIDAILNDLENLEDRQFIFGEGKPSMPESERQDSSLEGSIRPAYLQMVMERLWKEETNSKSHVLRFQTLEKLGGVREIIKTHLDEVMKNLNIEECNISSEIFRYLITPTGTKIAHNISDLSFYARIKKEEVEPVVQKLSNERILRVIPPTLEVNENRYEIYHDVLGLAILDWQTRFKAYSDWLRNRAWGYARILSSESILELKDSQISIGRWWPQGLREFENRYISRMQMSFEFQSEDKKIYALDLRSKNGTTVNAEYLTYGKAEQELQEGDIIVLAGATPFQLWKINYPEKEKFEVIDKFPLNQKDVEQRKRPYGWGILINGITRKYDYLTSDPCYLSRDHEGNISSSENGISDSFLILKSTDQGYLTFEFIDDKHDLSIVYKIPEQDDPVEDKIEPHKLQDFYGIYVFNYRGVRFQIVPLED